MQTVARLIPFAILGIFAIIATIGAALAIISFLAGYSENARNASLIPASLIPSSFFFLWLKSGNDKTFAKTQNIAAGLWIVPFAALAAYAATWLPANLSTAIISTTIGNIVLWIVLVQVTRKLYRFKRQTNIAAAAGRPSSDPNVNRLSNNTDLATAIVLATFTTAEFTILIKNDITPYFFKEGVVVIAMNVGAILGFLWFNLCPNQSDIRELISLGDKENPCQDVAPLC